MLLNRESLKKSAVQWLLESKEDLQPFKLAPELLPMRKKKQNSSEILCCALASISGQKSFPSTLNINKAI